MTMTAKKKKKKWALHKLLCTHPGSHWEDAHHGNRHAHHTPPFHILYQHTPMIYTYSYIHIHSYKCTFFHNNNNNHHKLITYLNETIEILCQCLTVWWLAQGVCPLQYRHGFVGFAMVSGISNHLYLIIQRWILHVDSGVVIMFHDNVIVNKILVILCKGRRRRRGGRRWRGHGRLSHNKNQTANTNEHKEESKTISFLRWTTSSRWWCCGIRMSSTPRLVLPLLHETTTTFDDGVIVCSRNFSKMEYSS